MDESTTNALAEGGIADITTTGRRSGTPRRIEIYFHNFDDEFFITGRPGFKRDWLANLSAIPRFTLHLKRDVTADLAAEAVVLTDPVERRAVLYRILTESWDMTPEKAEGEVDLWVEQSPLIRFSVVARGPSAGWPARPGSPGFRLFVLRAG